MRRPSSLLGSLINNFAKAFASVNEENLKYLKVLESLYSEIGQHPTSAVLLQGISKSSSDAYAPGRFTSVWKGELNGNPVAIKATHVIRADERKKVMEVSKQSICGLCLQTNSTETVETDTGVEETVPSQHPAVLWHQRNCGRQ